ncbi:MAG: hypothetical protein KKF65_04125 [Nanoarchaeota archaeon]|nr:hypothetical protein [Nanoarchaeota archaeon]
MSHILRIGSCGGIGSGQEVGDIILSTAAIRDEATTDHYLPKKVPAVCDFDLTNKLYDKLEQREELTAHIGVNYTTCSRFTENFEELMLFHKHAGAISIDMETAATLLVSKFHGIPAASMSVVVDNIVAHEEDESNVATTFIGRKSEEEYSRMIKPKFDSLLIILCVISI